MYNQEAIEHNKHLFCSRGINIDMTDCLQDI